MKVSLEWLQEYVDIDVSVETLCDKMVMSGFEVEDIEDLSATMRRVVAGRITQLEKHPNADKLQICTLDVGGEAPLQIVTGATNVFEGAVVPVALHDSLLPNGTHIKKGKLRGVVSEGMLCSGEELKLKEADYPGAEVDGILIMSDDVPVGTDMREVLHLCDVVVDFKITANRPDCQSVLGIAREIAVILGKELKAPAPAYATAGGDIDREITVDVEDFDLCPRYMGRVVKNLRIGPSPDWMKRRLKAAGMRPVNNIVDITNYVLLETGQPMHAFDLRDIGGRAIHVRRAKDGETITTLDQKTHMLAGEMLVIADENAPSCLAGIMGGLHSEIKPDTPAVFFECAKFRRDNVRKTARKLGMRTESSARYEKGVDILNVAYALERALHLVDQLSAGDIVDGTIDRFAALPSPRTITVPADRINALLGLSIPTDVMVNILNRLGIETTETGGVLTSRVPSFRDDVEGPADLAEEIIRIYGYGHIVSSAMIGAVTRGKPLPSYTDQNRVKQILTAQGMRESLTYSFISAKAADQLLLPEEDVRRQSIRLLNPLGEDYAVLRTQLISSMLTVLATNQSRKNGAVRFFEVGKLFLADELPLRQQPRECPALCLGLYGDGEDFFTLKGVVEALLKGLGLTGCFARAQEPFLHPGRQATVTLPGAAEPLGFLGELHPDAADRFSLSGRVYVAQLLLEPLFDAAQRQTVRFSPLPRFPAVERDLALVCDADLPAAQMEDAIRQAGGKILESVLLFDVYQGAQIETGKKSVAYRLCFRGLDKTLTDADMEPAMQKIFAALREKGCVLRS